MPSATRDYLDFHGKVVLITGAATGIGRAVAVGFSGRGAKVAIGDINEDAARETLDLVERLKALLWRLTGTISGTGPTQAWT